MADILADRIKLVNLKRIYYNFLEEKYRKGIEGESITPPNICNSSF